MGTIEEFGHFRLAHGLLRQRSQTDVHEAVRLFAGHGAVLVLALKADVAVVHEVRCP